MIDAADVNDPQDTVAALEDAVGYGSTAGILPAGLTLKNNTALNGKDAGGTAQPLIKNGSDSQLRLSQVNNKIIGATALGVNQVICWGMDYATPSNGQSQGSKTITLPVTYDSADAFVVVVTLLGDKNNGNPTGPSGANTDLTNAHIHVSGNITSSQFQVSVQLSTGTFAGTDNMIFSWIAIGTKT